MKKKKKFKTISDNIYNTHERIAEEYGINPIKRNPEEYSYDAWNFEYNIRYTLQRIIESEHLSLSSVLDAGCGNGQIAQVFFSLGASMIVGLDFSYRMLTFAKKRMILSNVGTSFSPVQADLDDPLPFKEKSFDFIIFFGVIEHLDYPKQVLHKLMHKLKSGGTIVVALPRKWSLSYITYVFFGENPKYWGVNNKKNKNIFNFKMKLNLYRFYTPTFLKKVIEETEEFHLIKRIGFAYFHMDGMPGKILHVLGRKGKFGYRILNALENVARVCHFIPGGEYWVIQRKNEKPHSSK